MHILIGSAIIIGFIAFAFGERVARTVTAGFILGAVVVVLTGATCVIIEVLR